jgi:hypothetical protein
MLFDFLSNWTQGAGLLFFGLAGWTAFRASGALRVSSPIAASRWRWIGTVQLAYFLEVIFSARHMAHDFVNSNLRSLGAYQDRAVIQELLLVGVALCGVGVAAALWHWLSRKALRNMQTNTAVVCTAITLLLFLVETISLHAIDRVLYRPVGPLMFVAFLWGATALGVVFSALWARQNSQAAGATMTKNAIRPSP